MTMTRTDAATTVAVPTRRRPSQTSRTAVRLIRRVPVWLIVALLMAGLALSAGFSVVRQARQELGTLQHQG